MTTRLHDPMDDAAAYVIGGLEPAELVAFEAHLTTCAECRAEVAALAPVVDALALAVPQRTPRPELRERVLAGSRSSAASVPGPVASAPSAPVAAALPAWLPIAASVLVAIGAGGYAARLQYRVSDLEVRLSDAISQAALSQAAVADARRTAVEAQSAMAVLAAPDVARIDLAGQAAAPDARARALWSRNRGMVFTVSNLPPLPPGQVYQVWVVTAAAPLSAGLLMIDQSGSASVYFQTAADIPPPTAIAVTPEPDGGVPAPTGAIYLVGTPTVL